MNKREETINKIINTYYEEPDKKENNSLKRLKK